MRTIFALLTLLTFCFSADTSKVRVMVGDNDIFFPIPGGYTSLAEHLIVQLPETLPSGTPTTTRNIANIFNSNKTNSYSITASIDSRYEYSDINSANFKYHKDIFFGSHKLYKFTMKPKASSNAVSWQCYDFGKIENKNKDLFFDIGMNEKRFAACIEANKKFYDKYNPEKDLSFDAIIVLNKRAIKLSISNSSPMNEKNFNDLLVFSKNYLGLLIKANDNTNKTK